MPEETNHIDFTAADIEKYHKGLLSSKERHALEKAALDDPFLADALEGFSTKGVNTTADITELKKRLAEKIEKGKIIPIPIIRKSAFEWLKIAAMIILIAGAGLLVYQYTFNKKTKEVAENEESNSGTELKDTDQTKGIVTLKSHEKSNSAETAKTKVPKENKVTNEKNPSNLNSGSSKKMTVPRAIRNENTDKGYVASVPNSSIINNGIDPNIRVKKDVNDKSVTLSEVIKSKELEEKDNTGNASTFKALESSDENKMKGSFDNGNNAMALKTSRPASANSGNANLVHNNIFRGKIVDNNDNALPFASITNTSDSIGTYADAQGNFNIISPDSVLNVRVQSIGFNNTNTQLHNSLTENKIVLQQESNSLNEVVVSRKKINSKRFLENNVKIEEPEPADGWNSYDIYLANNLKVPKTLRSKHENGEVEVSFEVNKNGEPVDLRIEKSLCNECDKEAIRLIKEGPKWKHKAKKRRATVTVSF